MNVVIKPNPPDIPALYSTAKKGMPRIKAADLLSHRREIEIDHDGKIYRLRLTQSNKLILTA
ncbi:MAG: hemin uptake protein HemP [Burkholderiaceae bacterium]